MELFLVQTHKVELMIYNFTEIEILVASIGRYHTWKVSRHSLSPTVLHKAIKQIFAHFQVYLCLSTDVDATLDKHILSVDE